MMSSRSRALMVLALVSATFGHPRAAAAGDAPPQPPPQAPVLEMPQHPSPWLLAIEPPPTLPEPPPTLPSADPPGPAPRPELRATRTRSVVTLDGRLDEPAWQEAAATDQFTQKFPDGGQAPSERTVLRVLYDDEAVYVGFDCEQRRTPAVRRLTPRDRLEQVDAVFVALGTRADGTSAFEFAVSAAGAQQDSLRFDDTDSSSDWDDVWEAQVSQRPDGWSAELRIPLRILRFASAQQWGLQARRVLAARQEVIEWAFIPRSAAGEVSRYGVLGGLVDLRSQRPLELRPFLVGRAQWNDGPESPGAGARFALTGGLDLKLRLTPGLTLNATVNPDFAGVEADRVVLNLSNYEVFLPEKRPFMLEGMDAFATPLPLLYTRRIGAPPAATGLSFIEPPGPQPIHGALKLVGTVGSRWTLAALAALAGRHDARVRTDAGEDTLTLAPLSLLTATRLKLQVGPNAHVGFFGSAAARFEDGGAASPASQAALPTATPAGRACPDGTVVAAGARCTHDAFTAALDGRWRSASGAYLISGQAVLTALRGGPDVALRDGTVLRSGAVSAGGALRLAKEAGEHVTGYVEAEVAGPTLDYNALGYMSRQNMARVTAQVEHHTLRPWWRTTETRTSFQFVDTETLRGLNLSRDYFLGTRWRFTNGWSAALDLYYRAARFDDREVGDGAALERAAAFGGSLSTSSDPRRRVSFDLWAAGSLLGDGYGVALSGALRLRPLPWLELQVEPEFQRTSGEPRSLGAPDAAGAYRFGRLDATSLGTTLRGTLSLTPRLSLQVYGQLFLAARGYRDFSRYQGMPGEAPPRITLDALRPAAAPAQLPDSQYTALNLSAVLRWEFRPGSTLYLVYTRSHEAAPGGQPAQLDPGALRAGAATSNLLLKLTLWWS